MAAIVFPPNPAVGDTVDGFYGQVYEWDGTKWTLVVGGSGGGGGASVSVSPTPPASPRVGNLWWDTVGAQLYCWTGAQWAVVSNQPPITGNPAIGPLGGPIIGVRDGLDATPGMVGECISNIANVIEPVTNVSPTLSTVMLAPVTITLTPGDWSVSIMMRTAMTGPGVPVTGSVMMYLPLPPPTSGITAVGAMTNSTNDGTSFFGVSGSATLSGVRVNTTVPLTLAPTITASYLANITTGVPVQCFGNLYAWRMR